jgi:hypothetical protein
VINGANLGLRFLVELAAIAALSIWGAQATSSTPANVALAIAAPALAIAVWGIWSAPRASRRLSGNSLIALELAILIVVTVLLVVAGHPIWAAILVVVALANGVTLRRPG